MLKEREVRLIKKLLEHKKPITTEKMALFLGITSRTVKSDIKSRGYAFKQRPEKEYGWKYRRKKNIGCII